VKHAVQETGHLSDRDLGSSSAKTVLDGPRTSAPDIQAERFLRSEPNLARLIELAQQRLAARQVWVFGSRARGDHLHGSDWDILLMLPDDALDIDLEPGKLWLVGRDSGLVADIVADREADVLAAMAVPNTLAFTLRREGVRLA
jgi:predicted nucleotidyltransferase